MNQKRANESNLNASFVPNKNDPNNGQMPLFLLTHELEDYTLNVLYEMMTKNGFYLPTLSCHWLTKKVMLSIVQGNIYCPMYKDI